MVIILWWHLLWNFHTFSPHHFMHSFIISWLYMDSFEFVSVEGISTISGGNSKISGRPGSTFYWGGLGWESKHEGPARNVSTANWMLPTETKIWQGHAKMQGHKGYLGGWGSLEHCVLVRGKRPWLLFTHLGSAFHQFWAREWCFLNSAEFLLYLLIYFC